ncbi:MAG: FliH/SctL family protein [Thiobacillaceae bacterium]|jgi:flagellar assembly protein FliH|nr:FliH/SctL family protein [Thiobacillaceae bacterium]
MSSDDRTTAFERWEVVELAASQPDPEPATLEQELEALRSQAHAQGYAAGVEAGRQEAEESCSRVKQLAESFANTLDNLDFRLADMVLELALDVARQVVAGELAARPERILDVVNLALKQMAESTREARLLMNPEDAALVRPRLEQVLDKNRLRIVEDARIVRGGCLIETSQGDLDATLQARWRQVVQVLGSNRNWLE